MFRDVIELRTTCGISRIDITEHVRKIVKQSKIKEGLCNIYVRGKTCGLLITTNDFMFFYDLKKFFEQIHEKGFYFSKNAFVYLRSLFLKNSISIPVVNNDLFLEESSCILLIELGTSNKRKVIVTVEGA